jgi:hypothetical protein
MTSPKGIVSHNGMNFFNLDNVPTGAFWYREQHKHAATQQPVWTRWDVLYAHDVEYRGKVRRKLSAQFWSEYIDNIRRKLEKGGFLCEFYQIPLPPGHPDEGLQDQKAAEPEGTGVRPVGSVARSNG